MRMDQVLLVQFWPGCQVDIDYDQEEYDSQGWQGHRHGLLPGLGKLPLPLLLLLGIPLQLTHSDLLRAVLASERDG